MTVSTHPTTVITGASTGIGASYAARFAARGHDLVLVARTESRLTELAEKLRSETGVQIEVLAADLTEPKDLAVVAQRVAQPDIGILVNNAGMVLPGAFSDMGADGIARIVALNITAASVLAQAAVSAFVARGGGSLINLSSILALSPEQFDPLYSATKTYMLALSQGLTAQYGAQGLYVQAVLPGATRTEIWERSGYDVEAFPPEIVMDVGDLVDAALVGFDRREAVSIPPLADLALWEQLEAARLALGPNLSRGEVAARYQGAGR